MIRHTDLDGPAIKPKMTVERACSCLPITMGNFYDVAENESYGFRSMVNLAMRIYADENDADVSSLQDSVPEFEESMNRLLTFRHYDNHFLEHYKKEFSWDRFADFVLFLIDYPQDELKYPIRYLYSDSKTFDEYEVMSYLAALIVCIICEMDDKGRFVTDPVVKVSTVSRLLHVRYATDTGFSYRFTITFRNMMAVLDDFTSHVLHILDGQLQLGLTIVEAEPYP